MTKERANAETDDLAVQFIQLFEILEELNEQGQRLQEATKQTLGYLNSEGGGITDANE